MSPGVLAGLGSLFGAAVSLRADLRRRKLLLTRSAGWNLLVLLDVVCVAATIGAASAVLLLSERVSRTSGSLLAPSTLAIVACILSTLFLWSEGRRQIQLQRPAGIVFGEWLILLGMYQFLATITTKQLPAWSGIPRLETIGLGVVLPVAE